MGLEIEPAERKRLSQKIGVRLVFSGLAAVCCHSRPRRGARTRLAIRRAVVPARFAIPREQPHRARRALATQHGAPLAFDGKIHAARGRGLGRRPPATNSLPARSTNASTLAVAGLPTRSPHDPSSNAFHRLASCGTPRFGALEHACGQRRGSARARDRQQYNRVRPHSFTWWANVSQDRFSNAKLLVQRKPIPDIPNLLWQHGVIQIPILQLQHQPMGGRDHGISNA